MSTERKALRLDWVLVGNEKWGYDVVLMDPMEPEQTLCITRGNAPVCFSWPTETEARLAVAAELRELADRIDRNEK